MQLRGAWAEALEEARRARERCEQAMNEAAAGEAFYQQGELHRLQGDFAASEAAFKDASARSSKRLIRGDRVTLDATILPFLSTVASTTITAWSR